MGFRLLWKQALDGGIVAAPLAVPLPGHGLVVLAATEAGSVYALGSNGTVLWERRFGSTEANGNCGSWGISSTGVIDVSRGLLYVANADGLVHALRVDDGTEGDGWPVRVIRRRRTEYVWGGLRLLKNRLYVPVASYCDAPDRRGVPAEGRLVALDVSDPAAPPAVFDPVLGADNLGGIWGWGGVAIAANGRALYTGVGNAEPDVDTGYSNSMIELSTDLSEAIGVHRPPGVQPGQDTDLGAAPVLFHPKRCSALLAANSKSGDLLIWRQDALEAGLYTRIPLSDGVAAFVGAPSWSPRTQMLYDASATFLRAGKRLVGTLALKITPSCTFTKRWSAVTGDGSQPQPLVAGDLVVDTGGTNGGFFAQRATSGVPVWHYPTDAATLSPPITAGGRLIAGDMAGNLYTFQPETTR